MLLQGIPLLQPRLLDYWVVGIVKEGFDLRPDFLYIVTFLSVPTSRSVLLSLPSTVTL